MTTELLQMSSEMIAKTVGTVGSPLIVISELIKNAVDASATKIDIYYDVGNKCIIVENDHKGFSLDEIKKLSIPGSSSKKIGENLKNDNGMFFTGSKGLGLLSVFLLCDKAKIVTITDEGRVCNIILNKTNGSINYTVTEEVSDRIYTKVTLLDVNLETIAFLQSESEIRKLRHISTFLYKSDILPFPQIFLHTDALLPTEINFSCLFPEMLYDVRFNFDKQTGKLSFQCIAPNKYTNQDTVTLTDFSIDSWQRLMLDSYDIAETIPTRTNDSPFLEFTEVPSFEGRMLVYERNLAGSQLKTYGAGVNIYINDFALYNYLAEENDWLGLADYSQRKKATRLKPHNVFGYVNFPGFDENFEKLQISNERADFIQDMTFQKLMYLIKGGVMFAVLNIDVADKNPKYRVKNNTDSNDQPDGKSSKNDTSREQEPDKQNTYGSEQSKQSNAPSQDNSKDDNHYYSDCSDEYHPVSAYKPKPNIKKCLQFSSSEGKIIESLKGVSNLGDKIYNLSYELSKLDLQDHRYAVACLYRTLIESATKEAARKSPKHIKIDKSNLASSVQSALNHFSDQCGHNPVLSDKIIKTCRDSVNKQKIIDILNEYIHNDTIPDAFKMQETWNTMKEYVLMCLRF